MMMWIFIIIRLWITCRRCRRIIRWWSSSAAEGLLFAAEQFERLAVPAWIDFWGEDVNHDWPWWEKQFPYFVGKLLEG